VKQFKVFITEENGNTLYVDNGVVISSAARKPLPNNPDGWQDIVIGWERNLSLYGVIRNFSLPLGFVLDGAHILRKVFYTENIERKISLLITMLTLTLTDITYAFNYFFLYKGDLDLSTFNDDQPTKVTMNIMEGGISKLLKANIDTVYEYPFKDDPDAKDLYCDGINLFQRVNYAVTDGLVYTGSCAVIDMPIITTEGRSAAVLNSGQIQEYIDMTAIPEFRHTSSNYFIKNTGNVPVLARVTGTVYLKFNYIEWAPGVTIKNIYLKVISNVDGVTDSNIIISNPVVGQVYPFKLYLGTFLTEIDQRYFFILQAGEGVDQANVNYEFMPGSAVSSEFVSRFAPSYVKVFTLYDLYRKATGKITGHPEDAVSTLLSQNLNICVACGDSIRGFPEAKIKTKMNDIFDASNVQFNAGMGIEGNKLTLEKKEHYFDNSNPIALGEVKSFKCVPATDLMCNTLKIGSAPQDYEDINGRQEFNNLTLFGSPLTRVVKEYNLESPYRRDSYGFEYTRVNFDGKLTTDSNNDNDVWLVNVDKIKIGSVLLIASGTAFSTIDPNIFRLPGDNLVIGTTITLTGPYFFAGTYTVASVSNATAGFTIVTVAEPIGTHLITLGNLYTNTGTSEQYILKRAVYDNADIIVNGTRDIGLMSPETVFNLEDMSIKRIIDNHANWLHSLMWGFENSVMPFLTTDKNRDLKTVQGTKIYDEDADIIIRDLAPPLFIPVYFEIETKVPVNLPEMLENNPAKCFSFTWQGTLYKGFLMKAGISISDNASQVFKLLSTPDNDLSKLVV